MTMNISGARIDNTGVLGKYIETRDIMRAMRTDTPVRLQRRVFFLKQKSAIAVNKKMIAKGEKKSALRNGMSQ